MNALPRSYVILLVVSLCLNVFFLGALTMRFAMRHRVPHPTAQRSQHASKHEMGPPDARLLREMVREMGGSRDPRAAKLLVEARRDGREIRQSMRQATRAVRGAVTREPYDPKLLDEALQRLDESTTRASERGHARLRALAAELRPDERRALAARPEPEPLPEPPAGD